MLRLAALAMLTGLATTPAVAADQQAKARTIHDSPSASIEIAAGQRGIIYDYYGAQIAKGICPPGLHKKNNGCQPPEREKEWSLGQPLPGDVAYYPLPRDLAMHLHAPSGTQYVRVVADILLITAGNHMVLDAIDD
jgi:hypothetical protein